jgi:hypothetical protein
MAMSMLEMLWEGVAAKHSLRNKEQNEMKQGLTTCYEIAGGLRALHSQRLSGYATAL